MRLGFADAGDRRHPTKQPACLRPAERRVRARLQRTTAPRGGDRHPGASSRSSRRSQRELAGVEGVAAVTPPIPNEAGDAAIINVFPTTSPQDEDDDRHSSQHCVTTSSPGDRGLGLRGSGRWPDGIGHRLREREQRALPILIGVVMLVSFLLLVVVFRSIVVPLKAGDHEPALDRSRLRSRRRRSSNGVGART